jgi:ubiquinone/menaquinone biosynthesis C-methylase UbiE
VEEPGVVEAFDQISPVYDATRPPVEAATLDAMAHALRVRGVRSLLEVGVGTGRVARPLMDRGFEVTGVDASRGMLAEARAKGLSRLLRGSAYHLPLRDRSVDAVLVVHVLHLLDDPTSAIREGCRVGRQGVTALLHAPGSGPLGTEAERANDPRQILAEILARKGFPSPARRGTGGPWRAEIRLLEALPPERLEVISDRTRTEPLANRLSMIERRAARGYLTVPPDILQSAVAEAREVVGTRSSTVRHVEALATWLQPPTGGLATRSVPDPGPGDAREPTPAQGRTVEPTEAPKQAR